MARILAISSQVARGHVGLSAIVPALQALGHEVIALPTILLSNHPGHAHVAGERIAPDLLRRMIDALDKNGWLADVDAVMTGYLPSVEHVAFAHDVVERLKARKPKTWYLCDPVLGDEPKGLYIERDAAKAIARQLYPIADIATPNSFELGFIARGHIGSVRHAAEAIRYLDGAALTFAKSLPTGIDGEIGNLAVMDGGPLGLTRVRHRANAPRGTGDLMSAYLLASMLEGRNQEGALSISTSVLDSVLAASDGRDELDLRQLPRDLSQVPAWPIEWLLETDAMVWAVAHRETDK